MSTVSTTVKRMPLATGPLTQLMAKPLKRAMGPSVATRCRTVAAMDRDRGLVFGATCIRLRTVSRGYVTHCPTRPAAPPQMSFSITGAVLCCPPRNRAAVSRSTSFIIQIVPLGGGVVAMHSFIDDDGTCTTYHKHTHTYIDRHTDRYHVHLSRCDITEDTYMQCSRVSLFAIQFSSSRPQIVFVPIWHNSHERWTQSREERSRRSISLYEQPLRHAYHSHSDSARLDC